MPSLWESLPYALLEAMAAGNAIVATEVGGIPEAITHGQQGLLVPPGDSAALAGAIIRLLEDAGERKTLGAEARRRVRTRYRLDSMMRSVQDLYLGTLDAKRPSV
jgi:glycosyltransferase involved in cell wall biosynthesis